ncbi:MAG: glycosyltransferase family 39 protein [Phycisphaeraceae bacterium]
MKSEIRNSKSEIRPFFRRWHFWAVLGLTLLAGAMRFYDLTRPRLWLDEAATFGRVSGTFEELMKVLRDDGFPPLHYVVYWWLGQRVTLDPFWMRLIPALAGTLMVPVIYFLGRQLVSRPAALLAAAFACCSAYSLAYSRDAKMYMHTWFFLALSVACLLYWLRHRGLVGWLCWVGWIVAASVAGMLQVMALIVVALSPLFLLSRRPHWRDPLLFVLGLAAIVAWPTWYYYYSSNRYIARTGIVPMTTTQPADEEKPRPADWERSGLQWIEPFNKGIGTPELVLNSATGYLAGGQWPRAAQDPWGFDPKAPDWYANTCVVVMSVMLGLLALGALPWRRANACRPLECGGNDAALAFRGASAALPQAKAVSRPPQSKTVATADAPLAPVDSTAADSRETYELATSPALRPGTRTSHPQVPSPSSQASGVATLSLPGAGERGPQPWWRTLLWLSAWLILPTYGVFYIRSTPDFVSPVYWLQSAWALLGWGWLAAGAGMVIAAGVMTRWRLVAQVIALALWLLVCFSIIAAVHAAGYGWFGTWLIWLADPRLLWPLAVLGPAVLYNFAAPTPRQRNIKLIQLLAVAALLWLICLGLYEVWQSIYQSRSPKDPWASIWMPRYLGIVWPAVAVAVGALIMRLPSWPLRTVAIVFVLGANLTNGLARLIVNPEPPHHLFARDIVAAHDAADTLRLGLQTLDRSSEHGWWWRDAEDLDYYVCITAGIKPSPEDFRVKRPFRRTYHFPLRPTAPLALGNRAARAKGVQRVILWQRFASGHQFDPEERDVLLAALGKDWRRVDNQSFATYQFWTWRSGPVFQRLEYERAAAP